MLLLNFSVMQENQRTVLSGVAVKLIVGLIPLLSNRAKADQMGRKTIS